MTDADHAPEATTDTAPTRKKASTERVWSMLVNYQILRMIGEGGSGKVFEVLAPGGFSKALKVVLLDNRNPLSERELQGLQLIRSIRHPYLLSIDRLDIEEDHLLLVMELADVSLRNHYDQKRGQGFPGIPRAQLLSLIREAAEALDFLNLNYKVQHLDVKPENMFLIAGHLKVGDYGLVLQTDVGVNHSCNAITPMYAAPEVFDGTVSVASDQYSLAVVYMEMLTGQRPYDGATIRQMAYQHVTQQPDISILPDPDRSIIAKALSKNPADRFESCQSFVNALLAHPFVEYVPVRPPPETPTLDSLADIPTTIDDPTRGRQETVKLRAESTFAPLERDVTAAMTNAYIASVPSDLFIGRLERCMKDWAGELFVLGPHKAAIRFEAKGGWMRSMLGMRDWILMTLHLIQRREDASRTLVEATVSYHGGKIADRVFVQYARKLTDMLKRDMQAQEAPPGRLRQHPRLPAGGAVQVLAEPSFGGEPVNIVCRVTNISSRGLGLISSAPAPMGNIRVRLPGSEALIRARLLRCQMLGDREYHLGVAFPHEIAIPEQFLREARQSENP